MRRITAGALALLSIVGAAPAAHASHQAPITIGRSVEGRAITAEHLGSDDADTLVVIIGQMHGDERAGRRVIASLKRSSLAPGVQMWLVPSLNPDGHQDRTRLNARRVDINRNFPNAWRDQPRAGRTPASEPETRAITTWLAQVRPDAVISLHQPFGVVDLTHPRSRPAGRKLAEWMGFPARIVGCPGTCHGTLTGWVDADLEAIAITVELHAKPSEREIGRTADAIRKLAASLRPLER